MQRRALKMVNPLAPTKPRKAAKRKTILGAPARSAAEQATAMPASWKGSWQNHIHKTAPSRSELLGRLAYSLYSPGGSCAGLPLLIMLHGCRQTATDMALGTRMNQQADSKGFVVAYPQQPRRVQSLQCWRWFEPETGAGLAEADAIADLASALVRKYRLDGSRVYIAGLSAGAGMAALTALRHPQRFAAAALHSGPVVGAAYSGSSGMNVMQRGAPGDPTALLAPLIDDETAFPGMPVVILQGKRDRVVAGVNAEQLAQQFSTLNETVAVPASVLAAGTHREYLRRDFMKDGRVKVRLCLLKEVGHAWSGGDARLKFNSDKGPRAAALIWAFFAKHRRE